MEDYKTIEYLKNVKALIGKNVKGKPNYYSVVFEKDYLTYEEVLNYSIRIKENSDHEDDEILNNILGEYTDIVSEVYECGMIFKSAIGCYYIRREIMKAAAEQEDGESQVPIFSVAIESASSTLNLDFKTLEEAQELYNIIKEWILKK